MGVIHLSCPARPRACAGVDQIRSWTTKTTRIVDGAFVVGSRTWLAVALAILPICTAFVWVAAALGWFPDPDELVRYVD